MHMSDANLVRRLVNVYDSETSNNMANCVFDEYTLIGKTYIYTQCQCQYRGLAALISLHL